MLSRIPVCPRGVRHAHFAVSAGLFSPHRFRVSRNVAVYPSVLWGVSPGPRTRYVMAL